MKISTRLPAVSFLFLCILFFPASKIVAQVSGVKTIPGDYATITEALLQIKVAGVSGPTFLELQPGYNSSGETFPITIREILGVSPVNSITISPAAAATGLSIISASNGSVFEFISAYYVKIDGRPGRVGTAKELTIRNNAAQSNAISFMDGAVENSVTYCNVEGSCATVGNSRGIIYFGPSFEPLPINTLFENAGNEISNCIIRGINSPRTAIFATGIEPIHNVDNKIINNEVLNFLEYGFEMYNTNSHWTITGNSIYNLDPFIGSTQVGIHFGNSAGSVNNTISGNFIGGRAAQAGGFKWLSDHAFLGIVINAGSFVVENNVIQNFRIGDNGISSALFEGIRIIQNATVQITGNLIGGSAGSNDISVEAATVTIRGITNLSCAPVSITNNRISNIRFFGYSTATFTGILHNGGDNLVITGNQIDQISANGPGPVDYRAISLTPNPSCPVSPNPSAEIDRNLIHNITLSSDDGNSSFTGIELDGPSASSEATLLHNNEVYIINVSSPNGEASFTGLSINDRISSNTGNIIGSATEANSIMVTGKTATANAIRLNNSSDVSITLDSIANITALGTESASVNGISFNGTGLVKISGNNIHHLTSPVSKGIFLQPFGGSSNITIDSNIITGLNTSTGTGIETFVASEASLTLTATDNTISNWQTGIMLAAASTANLQQTFQNNSVVANQTGFSNNNGTAVDATCNWWGDASGPSGAGPGTGNPVGPNVIFSPWATIATYVAVNAGTNQTIYIGYGPTSKTLTPTVTVCGTPAFLWSTGAATAAITVSPTATTVYSVKVTDANGHEATDEVTVFVQNVKCGNNNNKVRICHKGNEICISANDVQDHLKHGDSLGTCAYPPCEGENNFSKPVVLSPTQAPGKWYTDRYVPAGFVSGVNYAGDKRLKHSIAGANKQTDNFYNTQGRKYDVTIGTRYMEIELYVPSAWKTTGRRMAGFWGTAFDAFNNISAYPIIEFTSEGGPARFRGYDNGVWINMGLPSGFSYNKWVTLSIELLSSGEFKYKVENLQAVTNTLAIYNSKRIGNVILQGHNTTTGVNYDIYWDDFAFRCYKGSGDDDDDDHHRLIVSANGINMDVSKNDLMLPKEFRLSNYPNPFAKSSTIKYELPFDSKVSIKVYDVMGRVVATLVDAEKQAGIHTAEFKAGGISRGFLYYKIVAQSKGKRFEQTNKMIQIQ